jgi:hypothetical protein
MRMAYLTSVSLKSVQAVKGANVSGSARLAIATESGSIVAASGITACKATRTLNVSL